MIDRACNTTWEGRRSITVWLWQWLLLAASLPVMLSGGRAAEPTLSEHQLKAAFLFNFTKFITWPESDAGRGESFVIGVLGDTPMGSDLEMLLRSKTISGRSVTVRHAGTPAYLGACHVVFISKSEKRRLGAHLQSLKPGKALTIGESEDFIEEGGMIGFVWERNKLRFEVNLKVAEESQLEISSHLLRLATRVSRK